MSLFVCGDIHGGDDAAKLNTINWPEQSELSEEDLLVILGDFGLIWQNTVRHSQIYMTERARPFTNNEERWLKRLTKKKCKVCFLDGNHENHSRLAKLPEVDFMGGKAGLAFKNKYSEIYHLKRGQVYTINDKKVLVFGGAASTDKSSRRPYVTWWPEEEASVQDIKTTMTNLSAVDYKVDYVLTHTCPTPIMDALDDVRTTWPCKTRDFLDNLLAHVQFDEWHFGHMHVDCKIDFHDDCEEEDILYGRSNHQVRNFFCHFNKKPYKIF